MAADIFIVKTWPCKGELLMLKLTFPVPGIFADTNKRITWRISRRVCYVIIGTGKVSFYHPKFTFAKPVFWYKILADNVGCRHIRKVIH